MLHRRISGATRTFTAPVNWHRDNPTGVDLHVRQSAIGDDIQVFSSAWEPTPAELKALNAGGSVILTIVGGQPPVKLHVEDLESGREIELAGVGGML